MSLDLRPGAHIRYHPAQQPAGWLTGKLLKASVNGEEWLVENAFGKFWLPLSQIHPTV